MGVFSFSPTVIAILAIATAMLIIVAYVLVHFDFDVAPVIILVIAVLLIAILLMTWWTSIDWNTEASVGVTIGSAVAIVATFLISLDVIDRVN